MKSIKTTLALAIAASGLCAMDAGADIIVVAPTNSTSVSLHITEDINFTITQAGDVVALVFDAWVNSDGTLTFSELSSDLALSLNGSPLLFTPGELRDNLATTLGEITPNDGYLLMAFVPPVAVGDTFTLVAGNFGNFALNPVVGSFNPEATQTFTGSVFLANASGEQISNVVNVPEPSVFAPLIGGTPLIFSLARRRFVRL